MRNRGAGISFGQSCLDDVVRGRERASGIGSAGVAREQQGLAAASSKIFGALVATAARFRHPFLSAKALERRRLLPDEFKRLLADIFEFESGDYFRGVAGKNLARGIDEHQSTSPSAHAGFGKARVVIRDYEIDADTSGESLLRGGDGFCSFFELRASGQQCGAILQRPTVILSVGDFHALGSEVLDEGDHLIKVIDVLPVH